MRNFILASSASLLFCSIAWAQMPPKAPPANPPGAPPAGQPGNPPDAPPTLPRPAGMPSPENMVNRIMQNDKNGDGKLSTDEWPAQLREVWADIDTNKDGFIDREELMVYAQKQDKAMTEQRVTPRVRGAGGPQNFEGAMKQANRGFKALEQSEFDAAGKAKDLESVQMVQAGLVAAKGMCATVPMSPQAKAKFGEDKEKYQTALRGELIQTLTLAIDLENAIMAGDSKKSQDLLAKLQNAEGQGHELFKPEEPDQKPPTSPANPAAGASAGKK